eukprot:snap_masked-scaffold_45-processed-gene-1.82-mRNA-1 protein AED:0.95 eAED:1.00 QI:0/-1/0/1/-1/1/1/0/204
MTEPNLLATCNQLEENEAACCLTCCSLRFSSDEVSEAACQLGCDGTCILLPSSSCSSHGLPFLRGEVDGDGRCCVETENGNGVFDLEFVNIEGFDSCLLAAESVFSEAPTISLITENPTIVELGNEIEKKEEIDMVIVGSGFSVLFVLVVLSFLIVQKKRKLKVKKLFEEKVEKDERKLVALSVPSPQEALKRKDIQSFNKSIL